MNARLPGDGIEIGSEPLYRKHRPPAGDHCRWYGLGLGLTEDLAGPALRRVMWPALSWSVRAPLVTIRLFQPVTVPMAVSTGLAQEDPVPLATRDTPGRALPKMQDMATHP
jgi:hypothetical protein